MVVLWHWHLLLAPLLLNILHLVLGLLLEHDSVALKLSHITDVACLSESEVMVHAPLASPITIPSTLRWLIHLCFLLFLLLWSSVVGVAGPFVCKLHFGKSVGWFWFISCFSVSLGLFLLFLGQFSLRHMFWLTNVILIILVFLASVALVSAFEIVVLAFWALPTTFWEGKESFSFLAARIFFGLLFTWWLFSFVLRNVSWHETLDLVKWLEWCWLKSWSIDSCGTDWAVYEVGFGSLNWYILVLLCENWLVLTWASRIFIRQAWTLLRVLIWFWRTVEVVSDVEILESSCHRWDSVLDTVFLFWLLFFLICGFFESFNWFNGRIAINDI